MPDQKLEKETNAILVGEKEIVPTMKDVGDIGYALVMKPKEKKVVPKEIPKEVKDLLNKYSGGNCKLFTQRPLSLERY